MHVAPWIVVQCCPLLSTSTQIYRNLLYHRLPLTGLNAFVYTGLNAQKLYVDWYGMETSVYTSSNNIQFRYFCLLQSLSQNDTRRLNLECLIRRLLPNEIKLILLLLVTVPRTCLSSKYRTMHLSYDNILIKEYFENIVNRDKR